MNRGLIAAALSALVSAGIAGCADVNDPAPFDPKAFQSSERDAASNFSQQLQSDQRKAQSPATLPTTLPATTRRAVSNIPPELPPGFDAGAPIARLSLREMVQRTVMNNLDVKVAGYDPAIEATRVVENEAKFDPVYFLNTRFQRADNRTAGTFIGDPGGGTTALTFESASEVATAETGISQNLESGGQAQLKYSTTYTHLDPRQTINNPYWEDNLELDILQPLLRNLGQDFARSDITIAQNTQRQSILEFRHTLEQQISQVEQTYWQLVEAVEEVRIQEELLGRTQRELDILNARLNQDVTIVQVSQARASVESRRATLVRARARVADLSDTLKRLMNDGSMPVAGSTVLLPATEPVTDRLTFDLNDQIQTGLENRYELGQQMLKINSAGVTVALAKNGLLPQLNLRGAAGFQGLDDTFGGAFDRQIDFNHFNWSIGLELQVPIGNRIARSQWQRALLQRQQLITQYRSIISQVALDVKQAAREVDTTWNEMVTTRLARFAADQSLNAIQQREDAKEPLTPTFVELKLNTQEALATAKTAEAQAISNYNYAIAKLELAKGTLLRYDNVIMEQEKQPFAAR